MSVFADDPAEALLGVSDEVHFVDRKHDVADSEQRDQIAVAAGLGDDARACVDQDDGQIGGRSSGDHVARVLFVSGGVGDDELAAVCGEVAVCDVDGDSLLAFGFQAVAQQGVVDVVAGVSAAFAVPFEGVELVFVEPFAVEEQPPDEG